MSTNPRIYLDFNATAPLGDHVRAAMTAAMADPGNPSSVHAEGRRARHRIEQARRHVARLLGRPGEQVVFTSGGTEANALGVLGLAAVAEQRGLPRVVAAAAIATRPVPASEPTSSAPSAVTPIGRTCQPRATSAATAPRSDG